MTTIHMHANAHVTPEEYVAALTDFGPDRSQLFGNSKSAYLAVHGRDDRHADVTEGSSGVWERLEYDWTNPQHVVLTTTESNAWGHASGHTYDLTPRADGTTDIDYTVVREGKNLRGWFLGAVLATVGKSVLTKAFRNSVSAIEAREEPGS
ncbi:hypothetical protein AB0I30_22635 [Nocardia tengchongensis]|uniref:SRPBCC family protein n=1 Tax=Nocardia tengchongensis TaxID=2055889 RepID=UPI00340B764E